MANKPHNALPAPLPAGELPDENSRIWCYPPTAIRQGEAMIKDDTRVWFEDRGGVVQISRAYPDHPRWNIVPSKKGSILNDMICAEVHMLARITAGLPELPAIAIKKMEVKQVQADAAYRLVSAVRKVSTPKRLEETLELLADRQPGQYLKLVRDIAQARYVPAGAEGSMITPDAKHIDTLIGVLTEELKRREKEMKVINANPQDVEFGEPKSAFLERALELHNAANIRPEMQGKPVVADDLPKRLRGAVDVNAEDYDDGWD